MGYAVFSASGREWSTPTSGRPGVGIVRLSDSLAQMRANLWRLEPGASGRRHAERAQEELFVVVEGDAVLLVGEPPEPVPLPHGSVAVVEPGTPLQVRNDGVADALVLIVGAPPDTTAAEYLPDA